MAIVAVAVIVIIVLVIIILVIIVVVIVVARALCGLVGGRREARRCRRRGIARRSSAQSSKA